MFSQKSQQVLVAMLGARRHYAVPRAFHNVNALDHFYTDICGVQGFPKLLNYVPKSWQPSSIKRLTGRVPNGIPLDKLSTFPKLGISYAMKYSSAKTLDDRIQVFKDIGTQFSEKIIQRGFGKADTLYVFDHNGIDLIRTANRTGLKTVYDVTVAPLSVDLEYIEAEREAYPGWESSDDKLKAETLDAYNEMDRKVWSEADSLICGSEYVKEKLIDCGVQSRKCKVVPYGIEYNYNKQSKREHTGKLRVLTVGTVSLRKGAPYILEVAKKLKDYAEFRVVGGIKLTTHGQQELASHVNLTDAVPRSEVCKHYDWADVFLLPSLNEGSAAVTYEALASGLPVICTPNTGSVVRDGIEGYIVAPRDTDSIIEYLMQLYSSKMLRKDMSEMAKKRILDFTPSHYGQRLLAAIS